MTGDVTMRTPWQWLWDHYALYRLKQRAYATLENEWHYFATLLSELRSLRDLMDLCERSTIAEGNLSKEYSRIINNFDLLVIEELLSKFRDARFAEEGFEIGSLKVFEYHLRRARQSDRRRFLKGDALFLDILEDLNPMVLELEELKRIVQKEGNVSRAA